MLFIAGCGMTTSNQRSRSSLDANQDQNSALQHTTQSADRSIPIIVNCIQVDTGKFDGDRGSCFNREGALPESIELVK